MDIHLFPNFWWDRSVIWWLLFRFKKKIVSGILIYSLIQVWMHQVANPHWKKKKSILKLEYIFEQSNIVDIWRSSNPVLKRYTFRKNHFSRFIQCRLDYIFISTNIQEYLKNLRNFPSFCSDHFPISCILESSYQIQLGKNFWNCSSSFINDEKYVTQMK